ncbi:hypothetical protein [Actinoalloteichus sp. GBA129-24]|uniref:hypothetical protein n=1 Tax=Actinoalloteichus sp. GBA129-24 TaxID=1612551 RepID=UPI0012F99B4B|nr:hypothetical protein [Actinoalloteichus sp. GBA129-24]
MVGLLVVVAGPPCLPSDDLRHRPAESAVRGPGDRGEPPRGDGDVELRHGFELRRRFLTADEIGAVRRRGRGGAGVPAERAAAAGRPGAASM